MPKFITRIELFNASDRDYQQLETEIKKEAFNKSKKKKDQPFSHLDEYYKEGNITIQHVTAAVLNATKKLGKKFSFTIMKEKTGYFS